MASAKFLTSFDVAARWLPAVGVNEVGSHVAGASKQAHRSTVTFFTTLAAIASSKLFSVVVVGNGIVVAGRVTTGGAGAVVVIGAVVVVTATVSTVAGAVRVDVAHEVRAMIPTAVNVRERNMPMTVTVRVIDRYGPKVFLNGAGQGPDNLASHLTPTSTRRSCRDRHFEVAWALGAFAETW